MIRDGREGGYIILYNIQSQCSLSRFTIANSFDVSTILLHLISTFIYHTGALEKQKLVYILNRDSAARLTISSPLEAHKAHTILFDVVGVDVGFENPIFACLEIDYEDEEGPEKVCLVECNRSFIEMERRYLFISTLIWLILTIVESVSLHSDTYLCCTGIVWYPSCI